MSRLSNAALDQPRSSLDMSSGAIQAQADTSFAPGESLVSGAALDADATAGPGLSARLGTPAADGSQPGQGTALGSQAASADALPGSASSNGHSFTEGLPAGTHQLQQGSPRPPSTLDQGAVIEEQAFEAAVAQAPADEALLEAYEQPLGAGGASPHARTGPEYSSSGAPASGQADALAAGQPSRHLAASGGSEEAAFSPSRSQLPPAAEGAIIQEQAFEAAVAQAPADEALLEAYEPSSNGGAGGLAPHASIGPLPGNSSGAATVAGQADALIASQPSPHLGASGFAGGEPHSLGSSQLPAATEGAIIQEQAFEATVAQTPADEALLEAYEAPSLAAAEGHHPGHSSNGNSLDNGLPPQTLVADPVHDVTMGPASPSTLQGGPAAVRVSQAAPQALGSNGHLSLAGSTDLGAPRGSTGLPGSPSTRPPGSPSKGPLSPAVMARRACCAPCSV